MCFFRKKKQSQLITFSHQFNKGENVYFKHRDDMNPGIIYDIHQNKDGEVIYDVQIGGECPAVLKDIKEKDIRRR